MSAGLGKITGDSGPVFLAGAFGQGNPGDEALLTAFKRGLDDWPVIATSDDPDGTRDEHGVKAVHRFNTRKVAAHVARSRGVVFAGGTVFKALHPACGRQPHALLGRGLALALGARAFGKPLALVGVGADAVEGRRARGMSREIVNRSHLLVLRDEESAEMLERTGAPSPMRVGSDLSWTLFEAPDEPPAPVISERVVIALSHLAGGRTLASDIAAGLEPLVQAGLTPVLQPWQTLADGETDDVELANAVLAELPGAELAQAPRSIFDARRAFAEVGLVVGFRFHSLVAAAAAGVPFVAVAHEPKLGALARRLGQPCVEPRELRHCLAPVVLGALGHPAPSVDAVRAEIDAAEETMRLLRVLLSAGRTHESTDVDGLKLAPEGWYS
jgi:polysaccharide pyruvyl transferase WcaK-like protein